MLILEYLGCGERFVDLEKGYDIMVGYDNLVFGNGIESSGGKDGILSADSRLDISEKKEGASEG